MCGISGIFNTNISLTEVLFNQYTRGPDFSSQLQHKLGNSKKLVLAHNRLKIIDLSDSANQPFQDPTKRYSLTFNGEIYNYLELKQELKACGVQFNTSSDTEVLLQALIYWGMSALSKLNGMFAFAFFDAVDEKLYLVRDRFGVKPLYYYLKGEQLVFASTSAEIARQLHLKPNMSYIQRGLDYGIYEDGSDDTAYEGLNQLQAGYVLEVSFRPHLKADLRAYYSLETEVQKTSESIANLSDAALYAEVEKRLAEACEIRLRADVPVAVALSGGLDSSVVAAFANNKAQSLTAFCFGDLKDSNSEAILARELSLHQNINCHFVVPNSSEWGDAFWRTLAHQDAPFAGISVIAQYLLYQKMKQHDVKVVLGGQGGDEAFLGYRKFQLFWLKEKMAQKKWLQATHAFMNLSQMLFAERARLGKFWQLKSKYIGQKKTMGMQLAGVPLALNMGYAGSLCQRQIDDVMRYSLPTLLRYEDRNSMAHSIESRLPFMDYQLMELACALPHAMKLRKGYGKWPLREISATKIPDSIRLARYKKGFDISKQSDVLSELTKQVLPYLYQHKKQLSEWIGHIDLDEYFSVHHLNQIPARFSELTSLCWLSQKL